MPAKAASLRITDAYRVRMVALRNRAKSQARQTWAKVKLSDLDGTYQVGMLALQVSALQRQAAQLSAGYLSAYVASETGKPPKLPMAVALQVGKARTGSSLSKAFRSPLIGVKIQIKDGKDPRQALHEGGKQLVRTAGLATDQAAREALRIASVHSPDVIGYQRAIKGTCDACMGLADGSTLPAGTPLDIHPGCECVSEPVLNTRDIGADLASSAVDQVVPNLAKLPIEDLADSESATAKFIQSRNAIATHADASEKTAANAITHEYGHFADRTIGGGAEYFTETQEGDSFFQLLKNTETMKAVRGDAFDVLKGDIQMRNYLLQGKEMFARAFHQYVAIRTKNPVLLKEIREHQESPYMKCMVWQDKEFEPIAKEFDRLLAEKGLT